MAPSNISGGKNLGDWINYKKKTKVITRLPLKDMDKFKCVSKSCSSMICHPEFTKAHKPCGGIFIHVLPVKCPCPGNDIPDQMKGLHYASTHDKNEVFAQRVSLPYFGYEDITPVINGLACLYTGDQVSLFNISTRELMRLPSSNLYGEGRSVWYALGFDPVDNVYKLLKVKTVANRVVYEILTLETSSRSTWRWRVLVQEGLPMFSSISGQSYFLNGIIYCKFGEENHYLVFDVYKEQFVIFNLPRVTSSIRDKFNSNFIVFGQFEGRLALARVKKTQFETVLEVWALEDHQNSIWSQHTIDILDELVTYFFGIFAWISYSLSRSWPKLKILLFNFGT
nr:F-box protein At4g19940-like [Nicotiana tomentosiformis]